MAVDPYRLPDDAFNASGFRGQDPGVLKVDTVTHFSTVLGLGRFVRMIQPDVPVVSLILVSM
jgi:hypothetical protein